MIRGHDDYGHFDLIAGVCENCQDVGLVVVRRRGPLYMPLVPIAWEGPARRRMVRLDWRDTMILRKRGKRSRHPAGKRQRKLLGVTCGCYARWMRQVAHIETNMKANRRV